MGIDTLFPSSLRPEQHLMLQLFVAIWVSICDGAVFCFSLLSPRLKEAPFNFSQEQVAIVSTTGVVLSYFSMPTGYLFDFHGPRPTLLIGGILNFVGWGLMAFVYHYEFTTSPVLIAVCYGLSQLSTSFFETGSIITNLAAFSSQQGHVVALQKTFLGLGSSIITCFFQGFFNQSLSVLCLALSLVNGFVGVVGAYTIRLPCPELRVPGLNCGAPSADGTGAPALSPEAVAVLEKAERNASKRFQSTFNVGYGILGALLITLFTTDVVERYESATSAGRAAAAVITLLLSLSFAVLAKIVPDPAFTTSGLSSSGLSSRKIERLPLFTPPVSPRNYVTDDQPSQTEAATAQSPATNPAPSASTALLPFVQNDRGILENVRTVELWILWWVSLCVWGCSTMVSSNGAQIYQSLDFTGYEKTVNGVYVSLFGIASALGRVAVGTTYPALTRRGIHVSVYLAVAPAIMASACILFVVLPSKGLPLPFFLVGFGTGMSWGATVLIITALFGSNNRGRHYSFLYLAGILTPFVFSQGLFASIYDKEAVSQGFTEKTKCRGVGCVLSSLMVVAAFNATAIVAGVVFYLRIKKNRGFGVRLVETAAAPA